MEYIDILSEKGEITGKKATRNDIHRYGYWHRVIHILIINSRKEILLQKRTANKEKNPNMWDISWGGFVIYPNPACLILLYLQIEILIYQFFYLYGFFNFI